MKNIQQEQQNDTWARLVDSLWIMDSNLLRKFLTFGLVGRMVLVWALIIYMHVQNTNMMQYKKTNIKRNKQNKVFLLTQCLLPLVFASPLWNISLPTNVHEK